MVKVLIFGANGALGGDLVPFFKNQYKVKAYDNRVAHEVEFADITDLASLRPIFEDQNPDIVVNLAAITDLEFCEKNPELAQNVNRDGAGNLAQMATAYGAKLLHVSTGGVFDGEAGSYTEMDKTNPINVYSQTKLDGEKLVIGDSPQHLVVRAGWLSSGGRQDKKFIGKIVEKLLAGATHIAAVNDTIGSPTFSFDFIDQCFTLLEAGASGLYHACNEGFATRHDIATEIVKIMGLNVEVEIADANQFKHLYFAKRPIKETMLCQRLKAESLYKMPHWKTGLKPYVSRILNNE